MECIWGGREGREGRRKRGRLTCADLLLMVVVVVFRLLSCPSTLSPSLPLVRPFYPRTRIPARVSLPVVEEAWAAAARRARCWARRGWEGGREGGRRFSCVCRWGGGKDEVERTSEM